MKSFKLLFVIPLLITMFSCEFQDDFKMEEEYSFFITGIKESITYVFTPANGRVAEVPDEVKNLTVLVVDELGEIVFEKRFYEWEHYSEIPDSIRIPALPAGEYSIYAMTCDYYNYWFEDGVYRGDTTNTPPADTVTTYGSIVLEPWIVNEGPIYVGSVTFTLEEDEQHVVIKMENISARITLTATEHIPDWMQASIETKANVYYDFKSGDFMDADYWNYIYMYLDDSTLTKNFYILPQTLKKLNIYFYNYTDYSQVYSPSMEIDPPIAMNVGDAITFKIDVEAIMAGAGSSVFEWEDIQWNDLGEIAIP